MAWYKDDPYLRDIRGEEALFVKILQLAIEDLQTEKYKVKAYSFFTNEDDKEPNSFIAICRALRLDDEVILHKVRDYYVYGKPLTRAINANYEIPEEFEDSNSDLES